MRKISFLLFLVLVFPLPISQSIIEGIFPVTDKIAEPVYSLSLDDIEIIDSVRTIHVTPISSQNKVGDSSSDPLHLLTPSTYMSYTSLTGNSSLIQKGDKVQFTATTEFELIGLFPVNQGTHFWYDLVSVLDDNTQSSACTFTDSKIAVAFTLPVDIDYMA
ncbi:MAG: hypothetical protein KGD64_14920, partial [Candidatus Heimdallarchaeota archaeon]|nr:hypothetical protein [Candidatus Heimdallarchaeota archaeon]